MRLVGAIIIGVAILLAPLVWHFSRSLFAAPGAPGGAAIDSEARIGLDALQIQIEGLQKAVVDVNKRIDELDFRISGLSLPANTGSDPETSNFAVSSGADNDLRGQYAKVVNVGERRTLNEGITTATPDFLEQLLGRPRDVLTDKCEPMTNDKLKSMLVLENVGPIQVRMLRPAAASLARVFDNVRRNDPDLYAGITSAGSLCVRRIRGTVDRLSTHSFGLSVDLNIDGFLDTLGDGKTQVGLTLLADYFRAEGWIWGAAFGREDSMHFEVSREKLLEWRAEGKI